MKDKDFEFFLFGGQEVLMAANRLLPNKVPNPRERQASFCPGKASVRFPPLSLPSGLPFELPVYLV